MFKNPKIAFIVVLVILAIVIANRFYQYYVLENFTLVANTVCDPFVEDCFVADCSSDDVGCDTTTYKKVEILAAIAPGCLLEHSCESFSCPLNESGNCMVTFCSEDVVEEGEVCFQPIVSDPVDEISIEENNFEVNE